MFKKALKRAKRDKLEGKSPSTQAGEFIREEIREIRAGKHGARSAKQAIAIGLSKARRAGVALKPPAKGRVSDKALKSIQSAYRKGQNHEPISKTRSLASEKALKRESSLTVSRSALSQQASEAASKRSPAERSKAAKKAAKTKGTEKRSRAAKKAARTRTKNSFLLTGSKKR